MFHKERFSWYYGRSVVRVVRCPVGLGGYPPCGQRPHPPAAPATASRDHSPFHARALPTLLFDARGSDHSLSRARTQARGPAAAFGRWGIEYDESVLSGVIGRPRTHAGDGAGGAPSLLHAHHGHPLPVPDTARHPPAAIPRRPLRPNDRMAPGSPWRAWGCRWHRWGVQAGCKPSRSISSRLASRRGPRRPRVRRAGPPGRRAWAPLARRGRWRPFRVPPGQPAAGRREGRPRPRYAAFHDHDMPLRRRASTAAVVVALFRRSCSAEI